MKVFGQSRHADCEARVDGVPEDLIMGRWHRSWRHFDPFSPKKR